MAQTAKLQQVPVNKLVPYERNAKTHSAEQVEKIKASIEEFGFVSPILIDGDYNIIAGHGRVLAAKELGMEKIPAVFVEGLTEAQRRAYIIADNKLTELGDWTGGPDVDTGATNRKLGSDMGRSVTGGGLHGKDLSKADVSVNIYAWLKAQETGETVEMFCSIGDSFIGGVPYRDIVETARKFIKARGGFEKFAEWGLI